MKSEQAEGRQQGLEQPDISRSPAQDNPNVVVPLAQFGGQVLPAPAGLVEVMATEPCHSFVNAQGTAIETLQWGDTTKPGLLLLHGMSAHADWWDFVAPMLTDRYHVVAMSWSGMGRSGWRESYGTAVHVDEALAVMEATGLFANRESPSSPPIRSGDASFIDGARATAVYPLSERSNIRAGTSRRRSEEEPERLQRKYASPPTRSDNLDRPHQPQALAVDDL